jgi:hypothetical protein
MRAILERHVDGLPEALRTVFVLRAIEDLSVQEVAQCLGLTEVAVRSRHFRARSLLREALAREIDATEGDVFAFAGARCDRIVAGVLARICTPTLAELRCSLPPPGGAMSALGRPCGAHRAHRCSLGLSTSRSWSATRLMLTIVQSSAMPGKKLIQYLPDSRYW